MKDIEHKHKEILIVLTSFVALFESSLQVFAVQNYEYDR